MSREPLATEGEATPGPDDVNPFLEDATGEELTVRRGRSTEESKMDSGDFGFARFGDSNPEDVRFGMDHR